jgi:AcrR family transcriptional regulator
MPKVSEEHKTEVRERLMQAAFECLREKGYERTTTRDILTRAGLSAGAFYHYFRSKDDLIAAAGTFIAQAESAAIVTAQLSESDPAGVTLAKLASSLFRARASFASALPAARVHAAHVAAIRESLSNYDRRLLATLTGLGEAAQSDGDLRDDVDTDALMELALTVYEGLQARGQSDAWVTSYERVARTFLRLLAHGAASEGSRYREVLTSELAAN